MGNQISEEKIRQALAMVRHPEIDRSLIELGMIKEIVIGNDKITLTMALPVLGIPIKDYLINSVKEAVLKFGVEMEVTVAEMTPEEKSRFLTMAQENWIG